MVEHQTQFWTPMGAPAEPPARLRLVGLGRPDPEDSPAGLTASGGCLHKSRGKGVRPLRALKAEQLRAEKKAHDATDEGQAIAPLVRNRKFESTSLQEGVRCELDPGGR